MDCIVVENFSILLLSEHIFTINSYGMYFIPRNSYIGFLWIFYYCKNFNLNFNKVGQRVLKMSSEIRIKPFKSFNTFGGKVSRFQHDIFYLFLLCVSTRFFIVYWEILACMFKIALRASWCVRKV